jgi:protein-disulfide isomerase
MISQHLRFALAIAACAGAMVLAGACGGDDDSSPTPRPTSAAATTGTTRASVTTATAPDVSAQVAAFRAFEVPPELTSGPTAGKPEAKVTLEMYEDFQCPHCLNFTLNFEQLIFQEYVIPGKIKVTFRQFPILGAESGNAALGAACAAAENKFWPYQKALFLVQADAGQLTKEQVDVGRFSEQSLTDLATKLGMDGQAFDACLNAPATSDAVTADVRRGQTAGVPGTPGFVLNGKLVATPPDAAGWRKLLDGAVAAAK